MVFTRPFEQTSYFQYICRIGLLINELDHMNLFSRKCKKAGYPTTKL